MKYEPTELDRNRLFDELENILFGTMVGAYCHIALVVLAALILWRVW